MDNDDIDERCDISGSWENICPVCGREVDKGCVVWEESLVMYSRELPRQWVLGYRAAIIAAREARG